MTTCELAKEIFAMLEWLPSGIDYEADPDDESPEDMVAHVGGLIWQTCMKVIGDGTPPVDPPASGGKD